MLSGLKYSRKKISSFAQERFSLENMAYTQIFIDYLHAKNPYKYGGPQLSHQNQMLTANYNVVTDYIVCS